ncbi:MAG TPA: aldose epimerase family protein [Cyclobacteriaceae bacterium]|nr:aldose epimerase family protein [Cyclobacteriaceae bacterium]
MSFQSRSTGFVAIVLAMVVASCSPSKNSEKVTVTRTPYGKMPDNTEIEQFTVVNKNKVEMKVITYGGIITSLSVPDRNGKIEDVVLGFDNLDGYLKGHPYFGATIGRYGNRIAKGKFKLDDKEYTLATNNGPNHLHGGVTGFDKVVWKGEPISVDNGAGVRLTYSSVDMEEGYPGKLDVVVDYILFNDNSLKFQYKATTDKKTIVNLTNHSYYNLTGMKEDILNHELKINASRYLPVDSTLIPLAIANVEGTPFDFRTPKLVGKDIVSAGGYDHCWIIDDGKDSLKLAAVLYEPKSGRQMEVYTTEPAIQFYTGNFLNGTHIGKNGTPYGFRSALCLETEHYPDSPNRPEFPSTVLNPGEEYNTTTITKFSTR